jgi:hypothetical protein
MATNRLMTVLSQGNTSHLFRQCISSSFLFWGFVDWQWMTMTISLSNACVAVLNCSELVHIFSHPRDVGCAHPATGGNWAQFVAKDQNRSLHLTRNIQDPSKVDPKAKWKSEKWETLGNRKHPIPGCTRYPRQTGQTAVAFFWQVWLFHQVSCKHRLLQRFFAKRYSNMRSYRMTNKWHHVTPREKSPLWLISRAHGNEINCFNCFNWHCVRRIRWRLLEFQGELQSCRAIETIQQHDDV